MANDSKYDGLLKSDILVADGERLDECVVASTDATILGEFKIGATIEDRAGIDDISTVGVVCGIWATQTLLSLNNVSQGNGMNEV